MEELLHTDQTISRHLHKVASMIDEARMQAVLVPMVARRMTTRPIVYDPDPRDNAFVFSACCRHHDH